MEEKSSIARIQEGILEAFDALASREAGELSSLLALKAREKGFTYMRAGGIIETINLMLVPSFYDAEQVSYLKGLSLAIKRGIEAIYGAWFHDPEVARLLPFDENEAAWIKGAHPKGGPAKESLWYRLDCHFHMKERDWRERISIFEINSCAVGGIHYGPMAEDLFLECVLPAIKGHLPSIAPVKRNPDLRDLLHGLLVSHAKALGRKTLNIVYSEDLSALEGITEGPFIVEHLKKKGARVELADPRELFVRNDELYYRDMPVDVVYRNFELRDILAMEAEGDDTGGIRFAFSKNRVISSLSGDFDHKSMWEVLASGAFDRHLRKEDAELFKKHLLWTRVVRERKTEGPEGPEVDLLPYILKNKDMLVLKPNRLCGGYGVAIGRNMDEGGWATLLDTALREGGGWVVQRYGPPEEFVFPLFEDGSLVFENHNIVYGLSSTPEGTGILGRVSRQNVVNIAQHGGLMPVLRAER